MALAPLMLLAACEPQVPVAEDFIPDYKGVETQLLDGDLVQFNVAMTKALSAQDVSDYAECAAAQYTLIRGYGFARHVRTNVSEEGGIWRADAVYTISPSLPKGLKTIDAEVTAFQCAERGIPTV
ncbi:MULTISPECIES: hypothetical protein [Sulfitobacter]|jgi:hypothetical protein|uniref:Lipoprotein n=2 Tax=Sulfitobacter TaxID=60136 RepID=A0AAX3LLC1_9RHOB|nr:MULTISPECIES: hypothetical protein [Sulfitobacter]KZY52683.1 hypothetical protein A3734_02770 [Sulfitobacter sp. HI0054]MBO9437126.1 hypothetical protein [Sulfitobacter sp. R18_2]MDF3349174.1 hypothetical protein [Sulfitobacter sp. KE12]MDF3352845.1 hypothetical protein [Sulfitobacter sp. KE27]MDF3356492.1 hypothetical protein [Sulfitobacter sp. KE33]|tara:strand:- start:42 stop:416 length:375 start_codon:yes stop_codon:yes gene_type:complete